MVMVIVDGLMSVKNVRKDFYKKDVLIINDNNKCFVNKCMWKEYLIHN